MTETKRIQTRHMFVKPLEDPTATWIEKITLEKNVSIKYLFQNAGIDTFVNRRSRLSIENLMNLVDFAPSVLDLNQEEVGDMVETVAQTVEQRFQPSYSLRQAGNVLGLSYETVRLSRSPKLRGNRISPKELAEMIYR